MGSCSGPMGTFVGSWPVSSSCSRHDSPVPCLIASPGASCILHSSYNPGLLLHRGARLFPFLFFCFSLAPCFPKLSVLIGAGRIVSHASISRIVLICPGTDIGIANSVPSPPAPSLLWCSSRSDP